MTVQSGKQVYFQLELARGAPSYNSGWIDGEFELQNSAGIFRTHTESGTCELSFRFDGQRAKVSQSGDVYGCGFGHNVFADATLRRKSRQMPRMSDGDPRSGH